MCDHPPGKGCVQDGERHGQQQDGKEKIRPIFPNVPVIQQQGYKHTLSNARVDDD